MPGSGFRREKRQVLNGLNYESHSGIKPLTYPRKTERELHNKDGDYLLFGHTLLGLRNNV